MAHDWARLRRRREDAILEEAVGAQARVLADGLDELAERRRHHRADRVRPAVGEPVGKAVLRPGRGLARGRRRRRRLGLVAAA
jgi:hypothetical protein